MPLPLAPLAGLALRVGLVAAAAYAARRAVAARGVGHTDQRAEDALDDADEGFALHRPADREQTSLTARLRRTVLWGNSGIEIDAAVIGRFRVRKV